MIILTGFSKSIDNSSMISEAVLSSDREAILPIFIQPEGKTNIQRKKEAKKSL